MQNFELTPGMRLELAAAIENLRLAVLDGGPDSPSSALERLALSLGEHFGEIAVAKQLQKNVNKLLLAVPESVKKQIHQDPYS